MRVAIIGSSAPDSIEFHIKDSFQFLGHEAQIFDYLFPTKRGQAAYYWLKRFSEKFDIYQGKQIAHRVLEYKPDLVIGVYRIVHPVTLRLIKEKAPSIPLVHVNPDQLSTLEQQQVFASPYDFYFAKDPYMVNFMREKAGLNAFYLPESFNPRYHKPLNGNKSDYEDKEPIDVLIFGNWYPYRDRMAEQLVKAGLNISLYGMKGRYFPNTLEKYFTNRKIVDQEKSQKIYSAKIVFNNFHFAEIDSVNCKYFEINGVGGFQVCDYATTLSEYSPVHPDKYAFKNIQQAIELIKYYLGHSEERWNIAKMNQVHFMEHHTYEHRVMDILKIIKKEK